MPWALCQGDSPRTNARKDESPDKRCYENRVQRATISGSFLLECDGVPQALEAMNQVASEVVFVEFVEVEIP